MSLINTESWMAFGAYNGDDSANATVRAAFTKAYLAAGYEYYQQNLTAGWIVRPHPVFPERQALVFSSATTQNAQFVLRKRTGENTGPIIGGFSLFVPSSFIPATAPAAAVYGFLAVIAGAPGSALNKMVSAGTLYADEIFRVRYDLQIGYGSEVQSSRKITPGKLAYLEYRITQSEIRVWLDDVLVLQKSVARNNATISIATTTWTANPGSSGMAGLEGRWAIADWYNLAEDATTPNVRLGPGTRVIGVRPNADSFAQFMRPPGYASNAAVAALPLDPDSPNFLKTDTVGAQDVYVGFDDPLTATAALVHAMSVKVIAQNVESAPHTMSPLIVSNGDAQGTPSTLPAALGPIATISTTDPNTGAAWTPGAAAASNFGMKLES